MSDQTPPEDGNVRADIEPIESGLNPLVAVANKLLALVPQIRATYQLADPAALRESIAADLRTFESQARGRGIAAERILAARYVLCTVLDEAAASTPWGGGGQWGRHSLLAMFHNETGGGEKVFQLMAKLALEQSEQHQREEGDQEDRERERHAGWRCGRMLASAKTAASRKKIGMPA